MISRKVLHDLEYDKILEKLKKHAGSERARIDIGGLVPSVSFDEVSRLLKETYEADKLIYQYALNLSFAFDDIGGVLDRAEKRAVLTMDEILKVGRVLRVSRQIKTAIGKVEDENISILREKANLLYTDRTLEESIFSSILSSFEMSDNASYELKAIRGKIKKCNDEIRAKLSRFVTSAAYSKFLQDNVVTMRDNRHVILVKSEFKGMIPGLIHGQSVSGSTLYVEPMAVFESNNRLKTLISDEEFEIERILREYTAMIGANCGYIRFGFALITELDIIFAKASLAKSMKAVRPNLNNRGYFNIIKGRHPLVDPEKVVPISPRLGRGFNILIITGPNTGGKTVTLKLAGLFALMTQTGLFIPAQEDTEMNVFEGIFSDIGDEQSIEQSLSTFSSHMTNIIKILDGFTENSLLLLDELGAGTDPAEGAALALAMTEFIEKKGAKAIVTTHYNELKEFSLTKENVENASLDFDPETFAPTYNLIIGVPGTSNAIKIAQRLGLNAEIAARAKAAVGDERRQFENIIIAAETARKKAAAYLETVEKEKAEIDAKLSEIRLESRKIREEREKFNQNIKKETKNILENAEYEAEEIIAEMKRLKKISGDAAIFEANRLRKKLIGLAPETSADDGGETLCEDEFVRLEGEAKAGDEVYIISLKARGTVAGLSKNGAEVKIGAMKTHVKKEDMYRIRLKNPPKNPKSGENAGAARGVNFSKPIDLEIVRAEINLIGMNVDEAVYRLEGFIDRAAANGLGEVRIIHGTGTGALGRGIQAYLKGHKNAASFRYGRYGEGERGVTVLTLK
ncbi:MAG: endonuclease MutS2 [Clostridiales bacterium]|jgi:DNA mismatch repair protein MutS2|nr:endonuclease MutS2 [Clostridiales bacterium]